MTQQSSIYSRIEYPKDESGINDYPQILCDYLTKRFLIKGVLLDVGCGKGFYVNGFRRNWISAVGIDKESNNKFPYEDQAFDVVFSKSTLEHTMDTEGFLSETKRVLIWGGMAIFLVPDWDSQKNIFYNDSTHVKPFTLKGLKQAFVLAGFKKVKCEYFYQLPFLWHRPYLRWIPHIVGLLPHTTRYKILRFSKERMLFCAAVK